MIRQIWRNLNLVTMQNARLQLIPNALVIIEDEKIAWVGVEQEVPKVLLRNSTKDFNAQGYLALPGLIDCHTHLVFAGHRANELVLRLQGASYADIAKHGGGILATVKATRVSEQENLFQQSLARLQALQSEGVTTVEIKSGYGLDKLTEIRCLQIAKSFEKYLPITVKTTYLGAHALAPEFSHWHDYIDWIIAEMLPLIKQENLADFVDVFCEKIACNVEQSERLILAAKKLEFGIKMHAEQLANIGGSQLAAKLGAVSIDHLEYTTEQDCQLMSAMQTTAVLLPGAYYYLQEKKCPPIEYFRQYKIPMAIATDCNPGTSPTTSLLLVANMAAILMNLTIEECLAGVTINAARALNMAETHGTIEIGKQADMALFAVEQPEELIYWLQQNKCVGIIKNGEPDLQLQNLQV